MKKLFLLFCIFCAVFVVGTKKAFAQKSNSPPFWGYSEQMVNGAIKIAPFIADIPNEITKKYPGKSINVFAIDLNSDGLQDYIVDWYDKSKGIIQTCIFDNKFKQHSSFTRYDDEFYYFFFVQFDDDPMLELFWMQGNSDTSENKIIKFEAQSWQPKIIINDFIIASIGSPNKVKKISAIAPWNVAGLDMEKKGMQSAILVAYTAANDDDCPLCPAVIFATKSGDIERYPVNLNESDFKLMTLDEIIKKIKPDPARP